MAKRKKKAKHLKIAGLRVSKPVVSVLIDFANTPVGRVLLAEALVVAAGLLTTKRHPVAAATAAGAGAADAAKDFGGRISDGVISLMHAAADRLRDGAPPTGKRHSADTKSREEPDTPEATNGGGRKSRAPHLEEDLLRQAVLGDVTGKKSAKGKRSKRH